GYRPSLGRVVPQAGKGRNMETVYMIPTRHLGDVITVLVLLYNRSLANDWPIQVYGPTFISRLFEMFDFGRLAYLGVLDPFPPFQANIVGLMSDAATGPIAGNKATVVFLNGRMFGWIEKKDAKPFSKVILPLKKVTVEKDDVVGFQFDSRSLHENKTL